MAYEWTEDMGELSGFGGTYEMACRAMVKAGLEWWDLHPKATPRFKSTRTEAGLVVEDCGDALDLARVMREAAAIHQEATGAMVSACLGAVFWVRRCGWEAYADQLRARRGRKLEGGGHGGGWSV